MIPRRRALQRLALGLMGSLWGGAACASRRRASGSVTESSAQPKNDPLSFSQALDRDVERLGRRTYSDQGIPVFLVCENLAQTNATQRIGPRAARETAKVASGWNRLVETWKANRPNRSEDDVAKLMEVLADRDFGNSIGGQHP